MSRTPRHGVFYTPKQNAILWEMEKIHRAAHDRSDNEYFGSIRKRNCKNSTA